MDYASFQCDGNGPKDPVTVLNGVFADNKSDRDYTYVSFNNLLANINKYIFRNPDVGSELRTIGITVTAFRQGVIEINKDVQFAVVEASGAAIVGAVTYMKTLGATINPEGRYAGIDDYITPRAYIGETNAAGLTTEENVLYAVAQGYSLDPATGGTPLTMESLTTRAGDVQDGYIWSYSHLLGPTAVPMRGVNQLTVGWTLFADPSITLDETAARTKLASSFTVNATTKVITVTANSSYEDLYDAMKAYKSTANIVNLEATPIDELLVKPDGARLVGYTGWTLVVNSGVTLTAGGKYTSLYFDTVTVNGAIAGTYADSTGTRVALTNRNGVVMTSYVLINGTPVGGANIGGTFIPGFVPLVMSRTITVLPTDIIRMVVNSYGYKPQVINCTGADLDEFTVTLEIESGVDTSGVTTTIRDEVAAIFGFTQPNPSQIDITVNQTLVSYFPKDVVAGIAYAFVSKGFLVFMAMAQTNSADVYSLSNGQLVSYFPGFKLRMNDTDSLGSPIIPTATGYSIPLVAYYFDQTTETASPVTILNASNAKIETAPWTQTTATLSEQDKTSIASKVDASTILAKETTTQEALIYSRISSIESQKSS
jgi:hypothetical protein